MQRVLIAILSGFLITACNQHSEKRIKMIASPAGPGSQLPHLSSDSTGAVFLSWVESDSVQNRFSLLYSKLSGSTWSAPDTIASSESWFVNWADYPSILAAKEKVQAAHVLKKIPGHTYSYNVNLYQHRRNGSWSSAITPHTDSTATEHGFVSLAPWQNEVLAIWLDGRQTAGRPDEEYFDITQAMTLRSAVIDSNSNITQKRLIDKSVCDCCNTSLTSTAKGAIAAYRNRTDDEIRDIYISRYQNGKWSDPKPVHNDGWKIAACPVNGPAIAATHSNVVVAWYTAANNVQQVKAVTSSDFGYTFSEPVIISEKDPLGRMDAVMDNNGNAYISWMERDDEGANLKLREIKSNGEVSSPIRITQMNPSRKSGFPQMELAGDRLIFAWTRADSSASIQTAEYERAY